MCLAPCGTKGQGNSHEPLMAFRKASKDWGGTWRCSCHGSFAELQWQQGGGAAGQTPCQVCDTD